MGKEREGDRELPVDDTKKLTEDALGLGPRHVGPFTIGIVDMIVGDGGLEMPGFVATKNEILQLAQYWATKIINLDFLLFLYGCSGSSEWRTVAVANRRLDRISTLIGEEEVTKAWREAEQAFATGVDQQAWKIFTEGTQADREGFQQEVQEELARHAGRSRNEQLDGEAR